MKHKIAFTLAAVLLITVGIVEAQHVRPLDSTTTASGDDTRTLLMLRGDAHLVHREGEVQIVVGEGGQVQEVEVHVEPRGFLGAETMELTRELRSHFGAPADSGILVAGVEPGSPAALAGLEVGDVVVGAGDAAVRSRLDLWREVQPKRRGDLLTIDVLRGLLPVALQAVIEERDHPEVDVRSVVEKLAADGAAVSELDLPTLRRHLEHMQRMTESEEWRLRRQGLEASHSDLTRRLATVRVRLAELEGNLPD